MKNRLVHRIIFGIAVTMPFATLCDVKKQYVHAKKRTTAQVVGVSSLLGVAAMSAIKKFKYKNMTWSMGQSAGLLLGATSLCLARYWNAVVQEKPQEVTKTQPDSGKKDTPVTAPSAAAELEAIAKFKRQASEIQKMISFVHHEIYKKGLLEDDAFDLREAFFKDRGEQTIKDEAAKLVAFRWDAYSYRKEIGRGDGDFWFSLDVTISRMHRLFCRPISSASQENWGEKLKFDEQVLRRLHTSYDFAWYYDYIGKDWPAVSAKFDALFKINAVEKSSGISNEDMKALLANQDNQSFLKKEFCDLLYMVEDVGCHRKKIKYYDQQIWSRVEDRLYLVGKLLLKRVPDESEKKWIDRLQITPSMKKRLITLVERVDAQRKPAAAAKPA